MIQATTENVDTANIPYFPNTTGAWESRREGPGVVDLKEQGLDGKTIYCYGCVYLKRYDASFLTCRAMGKPSNPAESTVDVNFVGVWPGQTPTCCPFVREIKEQSTS